MRRNIQKNGVTLFALVLTVAVSLILVTASIGAISNVVANNRIATFIEEMSEIENRVELYYIENDSIPSNGVVLDKTNLLQYLNIYNSNEMADFENQLLEELTLNNDSNAQAFYQLDLSKIDADRNFKNDDIYVVAVPSLHVYYLKGIGAKRNVYFSISDRISSGNISRIDESYDIEDVITITESNGVKISKKNGTWSNKLGITINTYMESGEKLYIVFNEKEVLLETKSGQENVISFDSLLSGVDNGLVVSSDTSFNFTKEDMESLTSVSTNARYLQIIKKNSSGEIISTNKVNTFNFDVVAPEIEQSKTEMNSLEEINEITLYVKDLQSGVKEIRYEYFTTYDRNDGLTGIASYYLGNEIDKQYLQYNGKVAKTDNNGKVKISLPKSVSSIKVVAIDNCNNTSNDLEIFTMPKNSIYYSIDSISSSSLSILFYGTGLTSGTVVYGANSEELGNNTNWEVEKVVTLNNLTNIKDKIYLKVKTDDSTRLIVLDIPSQTSSGTKSKNESKYNNPYIPNGFIHTEGTIEEGFVIQDISDNASKYNEFVWVPVDNKSVTFGKEEFGIGTIASFKNVLIDNVDSFSESSTFANEINESVKKYGGFYVARYEASKDSLENVRSIKSANVWNDIAYNDAMSKCNVMYSSTDMKTTLMTAATYDTIIKWLRYSKYNVTKESDSNNLIGNFSLSVELTGSNENFKMNNIYDIAGNVAELTSETYKGYPVFRGGAYSSTGINMVAAVRAYNNESHVLDSIGFRPIMYII